MGEHFLLIQPRKKQLSWGSQLIELLTHLLESDQVLRQNLKIVSYYYAVHHRCLKLLSTMMSVHVDETYESHTY